MRLREPLPRWITWPLRGVFWLAALPLIAVAFWFAASVSLASHADRCLGRFNRDPAAYHALRRTRAYVDCLSAEAGWPGSWLLHRQQRPLARMPLTPARFVGDWIATRPGVRYRISLRDDGSFDAIPLSGAPAASPMTGNWSAIDGTLVWLYDEGRVWPPDINRVVEATGQSGVARSGDAFDLIEADGSRTQYASDSDPSVLAP